MMAFIDCIPWGLAKAFVLLVAVLLGILTMDYIRPKLSLSFALTCLLFLFVG